MSKSAATRSPRKSTITPTFVQAIYVRKAVIKQIEAYQECDWSDDSLFQKEDVISNLYAFITDLDQLTVMSNVMVPPSKQSGKITSEESDEGNQEEKQVDVEDETLKDGVV